jgi:DNA-binding response OmpR family regulator
MRRFSAPPRPGQRAVKPGARRARGVSVIGVERPRILLVEDDAAIAAGLVRVLESQGYAVRHLTRGGPAPAAATPEIGLVILDLGLPDVEGLDVCRKLRAARPDLGVLILTARDQELDVVAGLDAGADDYLVKPFRLSELLARVRAHLRRAGAADDGHEEDAQLAAGEVRIDTAARRAWRGDAELALRPKEYDLLALLVREAGRAVTRERIMREVWDTDWLGSTKTLDTHVLTLRGKVGAEAITTLRGVGYRFELP